MSNTSKLQAQMPVWVIFFILLIAAMLTYQQYSFTWDEKAQREGGVMNYNYVFHNDNTLFTTPSDLHGAGFELLLVTIERVLDIKNFRDIYLMRHLASHIFFLLGALSFSLLALRLFSSRLLACTAFIMIACMPRIYAHSFFNSKDVPFMALTCMILSVAQLAFQQNKPARFIILGLLCGFATSIRIMGILFPAIFIAFVVVDMFTERRHPIYVRRAVSSILLLTVSFALALYLGWPYLWKSPFTTLAETVSMMSKFPWPYDVLFMGKMINATNLPWTYLPVWFAITTPLAWLATGTGGIIFFLVTISAKPMRFLHNTRERNFLICFLCFLVPILSVILMHSVVYDDWRHVYFVYPPFVMLGLMLMEKAVSARFKTFVWGLIGVQTICTAAFMVNNITFNQVYFNNLVSHKREHLRMNYEMDYWGGGTMQAISYILKQRPYEHIRLYSPARTILEGAVLMQEERDIARITIADGPGTCDYFITNYRYHPQDYPYKLVKSYEVLNSTVLAIYQPE